MSYDTNLRLKLWPLRRARAIIHEAMRGADIALPSLDDATQLTGRSAPDAILDFYLGLGARVVALKLGKDGSAVATPERASASRHLPSKRSTPRAPATPSTALFSPSI